MPDLTKTGEYTTAISVTCPHCGAPISNLGSRKCEYYQGAVEPLNIRVWMLQRIEKEGQEK